MSIDYKKAPPELIEARILLLRLELTEVRGVVDGRVEWKLDPSHDRRAALERELAEAITAHLPAARRRGPTA